MGIGILARRPEGAQQQPTLFFVSLETSTQISKKDGVRLLGHPLAQVPISTASQECGEGAFATPLYSNPRTFHQYFFRNIAVENHQIHLF